MNVLILIDWFAPAYKAGGPIQSIVNLVQHKIEDVHYRVICSNKDLGGEVLQGIRENEWVNFTAETKVWYNNGTLPLKIATMLEGWKPDVLFVNGIYSFQYNFIPLVFWKIPRKIISARGMLHEGALSQKAGKKKFYLALWKFLKLHKKNSFHATNKEEADMIKACFGKNTSVAIAVNFPRLFQPAAIAQKNAGSLKLISIGIISAMKNYYEVLQSLAQVKATISYQIYGPIKDEAYWKHCKEAIAKLPPNVVVFYKGDISSTKVEAALAEAHIFILPSKSENFGHAIYEALVAGRPVITSHNTPWNNLQEQRAGINAAVNADELSKAIDFFAAMKEEELNHWAVSAHQYAVAAIDRKAIAAQYRNMFIGNL